MVPIQRCICAGFFANAAIRQPDGTYRTVRDGVTVELHPNSVVFSYPPQCIVFHEVVLTSKRFASEVCAIDPNWLPELASVAAEEGVRRWECVQRAQCVMGHGGRQANA